MHGRMTGCAGLRSARRLRAARRLSTVVGRSARPCPASQAASRTMAALRSAMRILRTAGVGQTARADPRRPRRFPAPPCPPEYQWRPRRLPLRAWFPIDPTPAAVIRSNTVVSLSGSGSSSSSPALSILRNTALRAAAVRSGGCLRQLRRQLRRLLGGSAEDLRPGGGERLRHRQVPGSDPISRVLQPRTLPLNGQGWRERNAGPHWCALLCSAMKPSPFRALRACLLGGAGEQGP